MKEQEAITQALNTLKPYWDEIDALLAQHNQRYLDLSSTDHDAIGRVLRAHLVIENFIDTFLADYYGIENLSEIKLTFAQKAMLLPTKNSGSVFVRKGIIQLNTVRNKFGHRIDHCPSIQDIRAIIDVLAVTRPGETFESPIQAIEAFTPTACVFLSVTPHHLRKPFEDAFSVFSHVLSEQPLDDDGIANRVD